jgi:hypothetical protein
VGGIFGGPGHQENGYGGRIPRTDPALSSLDRLPPSTDNVDGRSGHPRDPEKCQEGAFWGASFPPPNHAMIVEFRMVFLEPSFLWRLLFSGLSFSPVFSPAFQLLSE